MIAPIKNAKKSKAAQDEDEEMMPVRRRANKKRRVQCESSVDEDDEAELDVAMASDGAAVDKDETPAKKGSSSSIANTNKKSTIGSTPNMVDDGEATTEVTPFDGNGRPTEAPQPGKKWVKVKKTE